MPNLKPMGHQSLKFSDVTLNELEDVLGLEQDFDFSLSAFSAWQEEASKIIISTHEAESLEILQRPLLRGVSGWNEVELESKFIAPLFMHSGIDDGTIGYFMERPLSVEVEGITLYGTADGLIAKGVRSPKLPYFCMQEFKKSQDHKGSADGQALAAMLAAQALNKNAFPIYGLYIVGPTWHFMVLDDKTYTISPSYGADSKDLTDIFKMLKALKVLIYKNIEIENKNATRSH